MLQVCGILALSLLALGLLGYHPFAEDGGVYFTALLQKLHPDLFPHTHSFAFAHLRHSTYLFLLGTALAHLPISPEWALLILHSLSIVAVIIIVRLLASELGLSPSQSLVATAVVAIGLGLPIAGTALYIADPHVTARALSTPMLLAALLLQLRKRPVAGLFLAALTVALHPLMGLWGTLFLIATWCAGRRRTWSALLTFAFVMLGLCAIIAALSPMEGGVAYTLAQTRSYWYLSQWQWFEWVGIIAPPVLLWWIFLRPKLAFCATQQQLALATITIFALASAVSVALVHPASHHLLLARMQPLRMLQMAYLAFLLLIGARLAQWCVRGATHRAVTAAALLIASIALVEMQRELYPASTHIELPTLGPRNPWAQAFLWLRNNTPPDAVIAIDPFYTAAPFADAQNARAISQRNVLPDFSKDGGVASVQTGLGPQWQSAVAAQTGIETMPDSVRIARLTPFAANWIVLRAHSETALPCPYRNGVVKVCGLQR